MQTEAVLDILNQKLVGEQASNQRLKRMLQAKAQDFEDMQAQVQRLQDQLRAKESELLTAKTPRGQGSQSQAQEQEVHVKQHKQLQAEKKSKQLEEELRAQALLLQKVQAENERVQQLEARCQEYESKLQTMEKSIGTEDDTKQQLEKQLARSRRQLQVQAADLQKLQVEKEELRRHLQQAEQSNGRVKAVASMYHNHSVVLTQEVDYLEDDRDRKEELLERNKARVSELLAREAHALAERKGMLRVQRPTSMIEPNRHSSSYALPRDKNVVGKTKSKPLPAIVEKPPKKEEDAVGSVPESQAQGGIPHNNSKTDSQGFQSKQGHVSEHEIVVFTDNNLALNVSLEHPLKLPPLQVRPANDALHSFREKPHLLSAPSKSPAVMKVASVDQESKRSSISAVIANVPPSTIESPAFQIQPLKHHQNPLLVGVVKDHSTNSQERRLEPIKPKKPRTNSNVVAPSTTLKLREGDSALPSMGKRRAR